MHIYTFQKAHWTISVFIEQREDGKLPEIASVDTTKLHNVCVHNTHNCWKENEREQSERRKKTNCKKNSKLKCQKRIPRSNCEYYAYLWKSISRFGPFEDRPAQHSTAEHEHEHTHSSSAWMRKMCCGKHSFYLPVCQPACLLASHLSCAKSAFPTLSYFYSLALYLVYVRALRIACEHLWVSHTKNKPNGGGESTRTPAIRTTLCIEYIFYTYVSCAGWLAGWLSLWSHGFYRLFFQWARAHKHIAFGVSFKC